MPYQLGSAIDDRDRVKNRISDLAFFVRLPCSWWWKQITSKGTKVHEAKSTHGKRIHFSARRLHRLLRRSEKRKHRCRTHCHKADRNHEANISPASVRDRAWRDAPLRGEQP